MPNDVSSLLPLAPAALHILVALADEDRHGYGIMQEIARQSEGRYEIGPGTLYDNIQRLVAAKLLREVKPDAAHANPRRRTYRLTPLGRRVLAAETARLDDLLRVARNSLRNFSPGRA